MSELTILIPMAGAGSRFKDAGYTLPKPLIDVNGQTMIEYVVGNYPARSRFVFIVQKAQCLEYKLDEYLEDLVENCEVFQVDGLTEGAACTTLLARAAIDNDNPLLIANCDQFVEWNSGIVLSLMMLDPTDGGIITIATDNPAFSYAVVDDDGWVTRTVEKEVVSEHGTVGIYFWQKGSEYCQAAEQMIAAGKSVNGEFYVCPVYNEGIAKNLKFRIYPVTKMHCLGTPEDLDRFLGVGR